MQRSRALALILFWLTAVGPALGVAPAEDDVNVIYLADMRPLSTNSEQNRRPGTTVVRVEMDGVLYPNSLGLRAPRAGDVWATFGIGRKYARFQCRVGLPDNIPTRGRLLYEVEADGQSIYKSPILRAGDPSVAVDLDVSSAQRLTVRGRALDATGGYLLVWADARLLPADVEGRGDGGTGRRGDGAREGRAGWAVEPRSLELFAAALKRGLTERAGGARGLVVLAEFRGIDLPAPTAGSRFAEELSTALIRQGVRLVERAPLEAALQAMKTPLEAALDPASLKELGRRTGAAFLIVGSLADQGATVTANARILRTGTGEALWAERAELRKVK